MTSYETPARGRWARDSVSGASPNTLAPGSMSVNWPDRKIFVGDGGAQPLLFSHLIREYDANLVYRAEDLVIYDNDVWRADVDVAAGAFNPSQWTRLTASVVAGASELQSSDIWSGGSTSLSGPNQLLIRAGSGVVVDNTDPETPIVTQVAWSDIFTPAVEVSGQPWVVLAINAAGAIQQVGLGSWSQAMRRDHIILAYLFWSGGQVTDVIDGTLRAAGTAETYLDEYWINGGAYRAVGGRPSAVPATLNLQTSATTVFQLGGYWRTAPKAPNTISAAAISPLDLQICDRNQVLETKQTVDVNQWDNSGTVTAVPAGEWTIQYLFAYPNFAQFFIQYGQATFATEQDAVNALTADWLAFDPLLEVSVPSIVLGAVVVQQGATNLDAARIINADRGREPFDYYFQEANTDGFYLLDGSRALTGDMDADGNAILNADLDGGVYA